MSTIKLIGVTEGETPFDGQYVVNYDPTQPGTDPNGDPILCVLETTPERDKAKQFDTVMEALEYWQQSHGIREDGKPNRPLTAFTVEVA